MLDYVDENSRLLSMKMALLKYSSGDNREKALSDYEELVTLIDSSRFDKLIEKIKQADYNSLSLEEKLDYLEGVEKEYDHFYEQQCKIREFHSAYSSHELKLADLSCIDIEALREMKNAISGYLGNKDNITNSKQRIEEINRLLVLEEKKRVSIEARILDYEKELIKNFKDAEGRLVSLDASDKMEYASVLKEYKDNGIDLEILLSDSEKLNQQLKEASKEFSDGGESLSATMFCYEKNPTPENKSLLDATRLQVNELEYRLILFEIANSLSTTETTYEGALNKREIISRLIKKRSECLKKKGVRFYIDPFSRTKVNEQLEKIGNLGNNSKSISKLKKELGEVSSRIEEMQSMNSTFLITINSDFKLLSEKDLIPLVHEEDINDQVVEFSFDDILPIVNRETSPNQVIAINSVESSFKLRQVEEKTRGVLKRVYDMLKTAEQEILDKSSLDDVIPELVIVSEPSISIDEPIVDKGISIRTDESKTDETNLFMDDGLFMTEKKSEEAEIEPEIFAPELIFNVSDGVDEPEIFMNSLETSSKVDDNIDLFTSVQDPFEAPLFFEDKSEGSFEVEETIPSDETTEIIDLSQIILEPENEIELEDDVSDILVDETVQNEETMPDIFWETQGEVEQSEEEVISLDDQIDSLLAIEPKTKKLAA